MGLLCSSYLSKPVTEKESTDGTNNKLDCGASSMQGWRTSQEDAHNCILDYDANTAFFAVYDGHGGHEVAQYCSQELPNFIKNTPEYKEGKIEEALTTGFLQFDALIATPDVISVLQKIAAEKPQVEESDDDEEEENVNNLYEEAAMPIEQVIKKYTANLAKNDKSEAKSPSKTKTDDEEAVGTSSAACSSSQSGEGDAASNEAASTADKDDKAEANGPDKVSEPESSEPTSSDSKEVAQAQNEDKKDSPVQNGEISTPSSEAEAKSDVSSSSPPVENGTPSKKGKGKAVIKPEAVKSPVNTRPKRNAQQLYKNWLDMGEDSDDSDEEDQTFEGPQEESSDDEGEGVNVSVDASEEESSEEGEEEEEEENEDDLDDDDDDEQEARSLAFAKSMEEGPGSNSGCTAVVALLKGNELYVANAGDSRCVVCRNGKAIEMSFDHKPADKPEIDRIVKAGGEVTWDGRVNGGLNLSRAIGDHAYKQNKKLSDREQMITALPDIKKLTMSPGEDEFMVLACDGIWNSMSSQEVVDFVRQRIAEGREKMSQICEEIFDHCLSPDELHDAGCDNMTAIIIRFKGSGKRAPSPLPSEENEAKRVKTDADGDATA